MKLHKYIAASLAAFLLAGSCITPAAVSAADTSAPLKVTVYGDATMDGAVDVSDAVLAARYVASDASANLTDNGKLNADTNLDGNVDGSDIIEILEFIAKKRDYLGKADSAQGYKAHCLTENLTAQTVQDKAVDDTFVKSQYDLTAKLMKEISYRDAKNENILLSPLSIATALAMTANGANGETRAEMEKLLGGDLSMEELNEYYHNYLANLPSSDKAKLNVANSIWAKEGVPVRDDYLQTVKDYYPNLDVFKAPFTDDTLTEINDWISDKTDDMIRDMLKEMDPNAVTYLINALAFDAQWETAWKSTYETDFGTDTKQKVTMMSGEEKYYISDEYAEGFVKPYAGGTYSFVGILPRASKSVTLSDYIGMMDADSLANLMESRKNTDVNVRMPKFKFDYSTGDSLLGDSLNRLGMKKAFSGGEADFSKLYENENYEPGDVYIGRVLHNTFIDVNEAGTKAAAATVIEMTQKAAMGYNLCFDRPFIFMIIDERTKLPVFIGSVKDPQSDTPAQTPEPQDGEARFTVRDADSDELIPLSETEWLGISTSLSGGGASTGPVISLTANPCIINEDILRNIGSPNFSMSVFGNFLPVGYELPENNSLTWKKNSNGSFDVTVELKKTPQPLNKGEVRYTVVDAETGKLVPWNGAEFFTVNTDIRYDAQDGWTTTGPITGLEQNTQIEKGLATLMNADYFAMWVTAEKLPAGYTLEGYSLSWEKHDNGSWDVVIKLHHEDAVAYEAALPALNPGEVRFTVVDAETGKRIQLPAASFSRPNDGMHALIDHNNSTASHGYGYRTYFGTNPFTVMNYAKLFEKDIDAMELKDIPAGYTLPEKDYLKVTKNTNGSYDVTIKLKSDAKQVLKNGEIRFKAVNADTGELIPVTVDDPLIVKNMAELSEYSDQIGLAYGPFISEMTANPFTLKAFEGEGVIEKYSAEVTYDSIPAGYTLPENAVTVEKLENNRFEVTIKLKAMSELKSGQVRFTAIDTETGEQIALSEENAICISTNIMYNTPNGPVYSGPIIRMVKNPYIADNFAHHFNADSFSMNLDAYNLPEGYTTSGARTMVSKRHENGSADILIRLKPMEALKEGEARFTVVDYYTGEEIRLDKDNSLLIYTDYIEMPENPVLGLPVYKLDENPKIIANAAGSCDPDNNLQPVVHLNTLSGSYELQSNRATIIKHSNGSVDVKIKLRPIVDPAN